MWVFIKDRDTFATKGCYAAGSFDIVLDSIFTDKSKITIPGKPAVAEGDFICCDNGYLGIIPTLDPDVDADKTSVSCTHVRELFDFDTVYDPFQTTLPTYEQGIALVILAWAAGDQHNAGADTLFAKNFIKIGRTTYTPAGSTIIVPQKKDGLYNFKDYLETLRAEKKICVIFSIRKSQGVEYLFVDIVREDILAKTLDFTLPGLCLLDQSYSDKTVGKVTTVTALVPTNWYLKTDGTVTSIKPDDSDRVKGKWATLSVSQAEKAEADATKEFNKSKYSHLIEFSSLKEYSFLTPVQILLDGRVFESYISSVRVKDDTNMIIYKSGELINRLKYKI